MVGPERLRSMLGVGRWTGPMRAWGLGLLLPICALGALPVALELRRARIPSGTVISFVLVAPLLNPVSIVYGLSHVEPVTLLYFAAGTFVISTGIGAMWNQFISRRWDQVMSVDEAVPASGSGRLLVSGMTACQVLLGPVLVDFLLVLLVMGFLGAFHQMDALMAKFPVSQLLRRGGSTEVQKACLKDWVERLDVLREFLIRGDFDAARTVLRYVEQGHLQFRKALENGSAPGIQDRATPPNSASPPGSGADGWGE